MIKFIQSIFRRMVVNMINSKVEKYKDLLETVSCSTSDVRAAMFSYINDTSPTDLKSGRILSYGMDVACQIADHEGASIITQRSLMSHFVRVNNVYIVYLDDQIKTSTEQAHEELRATSSEGTDHARH